MESVLNVKNLKVGQEVKNYKEMCSLLGQNVLDSNSKIAQIKEWQRYFDFKKEGRKFVVIEVYENPLPEPFRSDDIYTAYLQVILCNYLMQEQNLVNHCSCKLTKKQLYELCGMVNRSYVNDEDKVIKLNNFQTVNDITYKNAKWQINELNQRVSSRLSKILYRCLNRLKAKKYIHYTDIYTIVEKSEKQKIVRDATKEEISDYLSEIQFLKQELGITLINDYNSNIFYSALNDVLKEKYGWESCFPQIQIIIAKGFMKQAYEESLSLLKEEVDKNKYSVNQNVVQMFYNIIDAEYEKNRQQIEEKRKEIVNQLDEWGDSNKWVSDKEVREKYPNMRMLHENYVELQKQLVDTFIKLN
ncbi:MAG: hypothetical protein VB100_14450 [Angelakisella sp.]|nr:hypothetical protein [Angelakisella sp.]